MEREFYILFRDRSEQSLNYPYDIELERLLSYETALYYYKEWVCNPWGETVELKPIVITNNENLFLQYRHILNEGEFQLFCSDNLPDYKNGLSGEFGIETFQHFINIKNGLYTKANQFKKYGIWHEEKTGNSYDFIEDEGWKTSNDTINSKIIMDNINKKIL